VGPANGLLLMSLGEPGPADGGRALCWPPLALGLGAGKTAGRETISGQGHRQRHWGAFGPGERLLGPGF